MVLSQGSDGPQDPGVAPGDEISADARVMLAALLRLDRDHARRIRSALPPRRRPPGMTGPSADLGSDD